MNQNGSNNVGPRGPHGSAYSYILRGVDTSISQHADGSALGTPTNAQAANSQYTRDNLCINCHASDVYGYGLGDRVPSNNNLSGIAHYSTFRPDRCGNPDGSNVNGRNQVGNKQGTGCYNCHAGIAHNYGAHSSTFGTANGFGGGAGFMNGDCWTQAPAGGKCYASNNGTWSTCSKGTHN
jgi:hypothetical protein